MQTRSGIGRASTPASWSPAPGNTRCPLRRASAVRSCPLLSLPSRRSCCCGTARGWWRTIPDLLPFERTRSEALLLRIRDVVYGSVYGVVTIAIIQGVLNGGMFWLLGVPAAALWGLVTVFASMVPLVGTAAVWVPGTLYLLAIGAWQKAIVLALWGAAVVSSVDNFLRPRLVAGRVGLSGLAMFVAMLGGLQAFGALGIVLGPVTFAAAAAIVDVLRETEPPRAPRADAPQEGDIV